MKKKINALNIFCAGEFSKMLMMNNLSSKLFCKSYYSVYPKYSLFTSMLPSNVNLITYKFSQNDNNYIDEIRKKKVLYRSKLRGMKETDILLGTFAVKYIDTLNANQMKQYEDILNEADPDIYNWITEHQTIPKEFNNEVMKMLIAHREDIQHNKLETFTLDKRFHTLN